MEVWTIIRNDEKYGDLVKHFPVRMTVSGTLEQAKRVARSIGRYELLPDLFYVEGDPE